MSDNLGVCVNRALISVHDKTGITELAKGLRDLGIEIISTGGTASLLMNSGIRVTEVSRVTGFPELFDGRVKTLHPKIHGAILFRRDLKHHREQAEKAEIQQIDLVIVNLYPFEKTARQDGTNIERLVEMIDIGGSALIRAAAKNHNFVAVVVDPEDYQSLLDELKNNQRRLGQATLRRLMTKAFAVTAAYDAEIFHVFRKLFAPAELFPASMIVSLSKASDLRYGENPHQKGAAYSFSTDGPSLVNTKPLTGKALSYNNLLDADAALSVLREFIEENFCVIVKHTNPCGAALGTTQLEAVTSAYATDPLSSFGSIYGFTKKMEKATAEAIADKFIEVVLAPGYEEKALQILSEKESRRILDISLFVKQTDCRGGLLFRSIDGGMLCQQPDRVTYEKSTIRVATRRQPNESIMRALSLGWKIAKHVRSNAIVICNEKMILGIGAGQMSRVDSTKLAIEKGGVSGFDLEGSSMASDAFFPFRDSIDLAAEAGVQAIIQPGGSIRDEEVIRAADEHGICMILTGIRHFRH